MKVKKKQYSSNVLTKFHDKILERPNEFSEEIKKQVLLQKEMLEKYDFKVERGEKVVNWIEKYCILVEGENAGKPVTLTLWQKWFIYSIFCFYGNIEVELFDEDGEFLGTKEKYTRIVNDALLLIGSGNSKTTLVAFIITYIMYSSEFVAPNIYIGSNSYKQSKLCFDTVRKVIEANKILNKFASIRASIGEIEVKKNNAKLNAMSSDGTNQEGIIPALIVIDEIHGMKTNTYASNLRKSVKRDDAIVLEMSTQGDVRNGYLDERLELAHNLLNGETDEKDYRKYFAIFKQDNIEEILNAYHLNDITRLRKSNPSMGVAVSVSLLKDKIKSMINDPSQRITVLTKNFNIPQNPITSYFSEKECRAKQFDESIFEYAPVFIGLDMAYTRNPENDLACLELLTVNPLTGEEYCKDYYFLPKYWERQSIKDGKIEIELNDMIIEKSKQDANILYNKRQNKYGYQMYADRGDVVIIDEQLIEELIAIYGESARCDCTGVTEDFMIYYIAYLERKYQFFVCKFGLDPNKATKIESFANQNVNSQDGLPPVIKFRMEDKRISNPIIESTKEVRAQELVYNNNKLTELHFASVQAKTGNNGITLTNSQRDRKDGVIANLSARSAYNVFVSNSKTGEQNLNNLKEWWSNRERMAKENLSE